MSNERNDSKKKINTENERQKFFNFIEDLSWFLDSHKDINFKGASKYLSTYRYSNLNNLIYDRKTSQYNLIGVLPSLLNDQEIFQSNFQLVQFADEVLAMNIPRWEKRSRNEIIGLIICEVEDVNRERLDLLIEWSENLLSNKNRVKSMQSSAINSGNLFSWNEIIQKLVGLENEQKNL